MSKIVDEVVGANQKYAREFGAKSELALPPARQFAILTCMDARLDPAKYAGLAEGDALSFAMPAVAPRTTRYGPSSSLTSCSAPASGS
jgi:carbonic anhydrase